MGRKKKQISEADLINLWMVKYHGITIEDAFEKDPWTNSRDFYARYKCTQEQHDAWVIEAKKFIRDNMKLTIKYVDRSWPLIYLNCSPQIEDEVENA